MDLLRSVTSLEGLACLQACAADQATAVTSQALGWLAGNARNSGARRIKNRSTKREQIQFPVVTAEKQRIGKIQGTRYNTSTPIRRLLGQMIGKGLENSAASIADP